MPGNVLHGRTFARHRGGLPDWIVITAEPFNSGSTAVPHLDRSKSKTRVLVKGRVGKAKRTDAASYAVARMIGCDNIARSIYMTARALEIAAERAKEIS